jgi:hypothetical protein
MAAWARSNHDKVTSRMPFDAAVRMIVFPFAVETECYLQTPLMGS